VQAVHLKAVREFFEAYKPDEARINLRHITMADFLLVLKERKPSVSLKMLDLYEKWYAQFKAL